MIDKPLEHTPLGSHSVKSSEATRVGRYIEEWCASLSATTKYRKQFLTLIALSHAFIPHVYFPHVDIFHVVYWAWQQYNFELHGMRRLMFRSRVRNHRRVETASIVNGIFCIQPSHSNKRRLCNWSSYQQAHMRIRLYARCWGVKRWASYSTRMINMINPLLLPPSTEIISSSYLRAPRGGK